MSPLVYTPIFLFALLLQFVAAGIQIHGSSTSYVDTAGAWRLLSANDIDGDGSLGTDGYIFEWEIRTDLAMGDDYIIQGSENFSFDDSIEITEYELVSKTPVDAVVSKVRIKVNSTSNSCFLSLSLPE